MMHIKDIKNRIAFLIILALLLIYASVIYHYTSFMPISDDYGAVLGFLNDYVQEKSVMKKLQMLFLQHNEHRIVFNRIVEIVQLKLSDSVNFYILVMVGNIGWILLILLLWKSVCKRKIVTMYTFIPVVLIMLNFSHSALMTWAMASLQQYWQLLFSLLTLYFLTKDKFSKTIFFLICAVFTGGGGVALIPFVLVHYVMKKEWKKLTQALVIIIFLLLIYFILFDYQSRTLHRNFYDILIVHSERFLQYILCFIGNIGDTVERALYVGSILIIFSLITIKKLFEKESFLVYAILFIVSISILAAISRSESGLAQAMSSRYAIYSTLLLTLVYLQYMLLYPKYKFIIILGYIVGIVLFVYYFIATLPAFAERKHIAETKLDLPVPHVAEHILLQSKMLGVFTGSDRIILPSKFTQLKKIDANIDINITLNGRKIAKNESNTVIKLLPSVLNINIAGNSYDIDNQLPSCAVRVVLNNHISILYMDSPTLHDIMLGIKPTHFSGNIDISYLDAKRYKLSIEAMNYNCTGYTINDKLYIKKSNFDALLKLPIVKKKLRGWIDKFLYKKDKIEIVGWYAFNGEEVKSKTLIVDIDGKKYLSRYGYNRTEVANTLKNNAYKYSGFKLYIGRDMLKGLHHTVKILLLSNDHSILYEDLHIYKFTLD